MVNLLLGTFVYKMVLYYLCPLKETFKRVRSYVRMPTALRWTLSVLPGFRFSCGVMWTSGE